MTKKVLESLPKTIFSILALSQRNFEDLEISQICNMAALKPLKWKYFVIFSFRVFISTIKTFNIFDLKIFNFALYSTTKVIHFVKHFL